MHKIKFQKHLYNFVLGYHNVVMIPPGASNIRVIQHSPDGNVDDNYIGKILSI